MPSDFIHWLHSKITSLWGNLPAWTNVAYQAIFGQMAGITALSAVLACWLTWLSIRDKMRQREDVELFRRVFKVAEETGHDALRDLAANELHRLHTGKRRSRK